MSRNRRIRNFYRQLWLRKETLSSQAGDPSKGCFKDTFHIDEEGVWRFNRATGYERGHRNYPDSVPMNFAIDLSWNAASMALQDLVQGDLVKLVHLPNTLIADTATPLKVNDQVHASACARDIIIESEKS